MVKPLTNICTVNVYFITSFQQYMNKYSLKKCKTRVGSATVRDGRHARCAVGCEFKSWETSVLPTTVLVDH